MEVGRKRFVGNGNQGQMPTPMIPPGFPVMNSADDVLHANLLHWSVTKNPNLSSSSFPSNSNTSSENHLTNPNPSYYCDEPENSSLRSSVPSSMADVREMIFRIAALQPINIDHPEMVKTPKRKNVRISKDPQSVAARHRRERISERIRILQRIVPGGTKMDTASMLDEVIHYVKFLKRQVQYLEKVRGQHGYGGLGLGFAGPAAADQVWGYHDNMGSSFRTERGDVS